MESTIAFLDHIPDWDESEEKVLIGQFEIKRFATLLDIITYYLSNEGTSVNHELISVVVLCLPCFCTARDFFALLVDRFDLKKLSNSTNSCRDQKQLKIMAILHYWLKMQTATNDLYGSLVDTVGDFLGEVIASGTPRRSGTGLGPAG